MGIGLERDDVGEAVLLRVGEIGAEPIETQAAEARRRRQVRQQRHQAGHSRVLVRRLAGESPDEVPERRDAELLAPFQELDVVQSGHALAHQLENRIAEAFDARLDAADTGGVQHPDLIALEIALGLVEQVEIELAPRQLGHQRLEVGEVEDVVHDLHVRPRVARRQRRHLVERARRRFAAERHGRAVQAAEGAVHPLAPPASARRFDERARLPVGLETAAAELLEVVREVGIGQAVHIAHGIGARKPTEREILAQAAARTDPCETCDRRAGEVAPDQFREHVVAFARDRDVNPAVLAERFGAHHAFAVGAAKYDQRGGAPGLDARGQGQRRGVLLKHAGEADDRRFLAADVVGAAIEEPVDPGPGAQDAADQPARHRSRLGQVAVAAGEDVSHVGVALLGRLRFERVRKNPLAGELAHGHERVHGDGGVQALADQLAERNGEVVQRDRDPILDQTRLQQAESKRRPEQRAERHRDERDRAHAGRALVGGAGAGGGISSISRPRLAPRSHGRSVA